MHEEKDPLPNHDNILVRKFGYYYMELPLNDRVAVIQYLRDLCNHELRQTVKPSNAPPTIPVSHYCKHCGTTIKKPLKTYV